MVARRRSKTSRAHGSWTHGWGAKKKHRGAGHRGGRGNAGSGKGNDSKTSKYQRIKNYFGKHGFTSKSRSLVVPVNVGYIDTHVDMLIEAGKIENKNGVFVIDCTKMGINKLLSKGTVNNKFEIIVGEATDKAIAKVEKAGGKVVLGVGAKLADKEEAKAQVKTEE